MWGLLKHLGHSSAPLWEVGGHLKEEPDSHGELAGARGDRHLPSRQEESSLSSGLLWPQGDPSTLPVLLAAWGGRGREL